MTLEDLIKYAILGAVVIGTGILVGAWFLYLTGLHF